MIENMDISQWKFSLLILFSLLLLTRSQDTEDAKCKQPIDLVFALDASGSVKQEGFDLIKQFTKDIINSFTIGIADTHVGVLTFSEYAEPQIRLTETFDKTELFQMIDSLNYPGYRTATDDALRVANTDFFSRTGGARQNVPQVLILLNDGKCTVCTEPVKDAAQRLKDRGIDIYTIGVTNFIKEQELLDIASYPVSTHYFKVDNFEALKNIATELQARACEVKKGKCPKPLPPFMCEANPVDECDSDENCPGEQKCCSDGCSRKCRYPLFNCITPIDIAFALDGSSSVRDESFEEMKQFSEDIVDSFTVGQTETRFAALVYSDRAELGFDFVRFDDANNTKKAIRNLPKLNSKERIDYALELAKSDLFSLQGKVRTRRPMVLFVFYDGTVVRGMRDLEEVAEPLKEYGVKVIAIGVGPEINGFQMNKIVSDEDHVFQASDFEKIVPALYDMVEQACSEKPSQCDANPNPIAEEVCATQEVVNECTNDFECFGNAKCCKKGCARVCVTPNAVCPRKLDIAFAIHENMQESEFAVTQYFLKAAVDQFIVSPDKAHVALMTFGQQAKVAFNFNNGQTSNEEIRNKIDNLEYNYGNGRLSDVLALSCDEIFCAIGGTRDDVPKMLVIITGPSQPSPSSVLQERLQILRNRGVEILIIGVGEVDTTALQAITSDDPAVEDRVLLSKRFDGILQYNGDVGSFACTQAAITPPPGPIKGGKGTCGPKVCYKGPKGSRGRPGKLGQLGEAGDRGLPGPKGIQGPKGPKGPDGKMGPKGERGPDGLIGLPGFPGYNGVPGVPGVEGRRGRDGDCGLPGASGEAGIPGIDGFSGPPGRAGPPGIKGRKGQPAPENPDIIVEPGDPGAFGEIGLKGFKGMKGDDGFKGIRGEDGEDGADGPPGEPGEMGDLGTYIDQQGPKGDIGYPGPPGDGGTQPGGGGTPAAGEIGAGGTKGEPGERGPQGPASNVAGIKGQTGGQGPKGEQGLPGPEGQVGQKGPGGDRGPKGLKGDQGETGQNGLRGRTGAPGEDGLKGSTGRKGQKGDEADGQLGAKGQQGPKGEPGVSGSPGSIGPPGSPGENGRPGDVQMGPSGDPGSVGPRGPRGDNGLAGEPGMIGLSGPKGITGGQGPRGDPGRIAELVPGKPGMMGPPGVKGIPGSVGDPGLPGQPGPPTKIECIEGRCPKGTPGSRGPPGNTGPAGDPGPQGPFGSKGVEGGPCPICPDGIQGNSGDIGVPGMPGKEGDKGSNGERGDPGPKGTPGTQGEVGPVGPDGEKGVTGDTGPVGESGTPALGEGVGPKGPKGSPGDEGQPGIRGDPGPKGENGLKGSDGAMGKRGLQGAKGMIGLTGETGRDGDPGRVGRTGEPGEGIRGAQGDKGNIGKQGPQGLVGDIGPEGSIGEPGSAPTQEQLNEMKQKMGGDKGSRGSQGEIGELGVAGSVGPPGPRGPKGFPGPAGQKGAGGVTGDFGDPGRPGDDGDPGFPGFPGLQGKRGPPGEPGPAGKRGVTEKGDQGPRGEDGEPGRKGQDAPPPIGCFTFRDPTDIGFILDSSSSVTDDMFRRQKEFVKSIIKQFPVGIDQTQAGIIKYGKQAETGVNFYDFFTEKDLFGAIDLLEHSKASESRLDLALKMARDELFTTERGARGDEAKKALVILGDGFISGGDIRSIVLMENARQYARELREAGVSIFALAVGAEKNTLLLQDFVSEPDYYLEIESYSQLDNKLGALQLSLQSGCVSVGEPGRDGLPGPTGPPGPRGEKGARGTGPQGPIGFKGRKGEPGTPGLGFRGIPGLPGFMGFPGEKGKDGLNGRDGFGEKGKPGLKGERGDSVPGPNGEIGDIGDIGPPGFDSNRLCDFVLAADLLFVLDSSSGIGEADFNKMLSFVKDIIGFFDVENQLTRVSVITYDSDARLVIRFSDYNNVDSLNSAIDRISYNNGGQTRIDKALLLADSDAFQSRNGARENVNKALVLMTDGQQSFANDQTPLIDAVKPLTDASVLMYAIGIGNEISPFELRTIADRRVIVADDFDALSAKIEDQIQLLGQVGCRGEPGPDGEKGAKGEDGFPGIEGDKGANGPRGEPGPPGEKGIKGPQGVSFGALRKGVKGDGGSAGPVGLPGCTGREEDIVTDLGFAIDSSGSLYQEGFQKEIDFIKDVLDRVGPVSENGLRVGVIVYSDFATIEIRFDDYFNIEDLKAAIDRLPFYAKNTRMDLGLIKAKELFSESGGGRGSSKKVLILMADGQQTYVPGVTEPSDIAKELATAGVDIFAIGIGQEIDRTELESLISKKEYIFLASDVSSLIADLSKEITSALKCEGGPRGPKGRTGSDGPPGDKGPDGIQGAKGYKGEPGRPGFGPQGEIGDLGILGGPGNQGEKGFRGRDGFPGPRGLLGPKGNEGPSGQKGEKGDDGFIGFGGPEGDAGPKGERGDSSDRGVQGVKGESGDKGYMGQRGDPGKLPPGNRLEDFKGERGPQGSAGNTGPIGKPGKSQFEPGPIGLTGPKGEKGTSGQFGDRGPRGDKGFTGLKGPRGDAGEQGQVGEDGFPGFDGPKGFPGDRGDDGRIGRKGEPGKVGGKGFKGPFGDRGQQGFPGFIGMEGKKGEPGEAGPRGRQQIRNPNPVPVEPGPKGYPGNTGPAGDEGPEGDQGEPGEVVGRQGVDGDPGQRGERGPQGPPGEAGLDGMSGFPGRKGQKGRAGTGGNPGAPGRVGPRGSPGESISSSEKGAQGEMGIIGLQGPKGRKGRPGLEGPRGRPGAKGFKGSKGASGFPGFIGEPGESGPFGDKGPVGSPGSAGEPGIKGAPGQSGIAEGFYIVRHSQDSFIPRCPRDYKRLWTGYSLMYTVGNGHAHSQDLGNAGSCARTFSTLPFLFCGITGNCKYASRNDFTYWLSGDVRQPMMPVSNSAVEPFISRCVVCQAPSVHIAVHSQDVFKPDCPRGWNSLWEGYSFMMVAGAGKTGAGQSLSSSGSCLESFKPKPFIECQGARGTCHFFSDKYSFWLTTIDQSKQFEAQQPQTLSKNKGDDLTSRVSRCRVCVRGIGSGNILEPGIFKRIKRSVMGFFNRETD